MWVTGVHLCLWIYKLYDLYVWMCQECCVLVSSMHSEIILHMICLFPFTLIHTSRDRCIQSGFKFLYTLPGDPYNGYINHYYWVYDPPLSYISRNNGILGPSTNGILGPSWQKRTISFAQDDPIWLCHMFLA